MKEDANQNKSNSSRRPLSIEGPSTSNSTGHTSLPLQPLLNQPRQPTNLQGLLKYAIDVAQSKNTDNKSQIYPLDEEVYIILLNWFFFKEFPELIYIDVINTNEKLYLFYPNLLHYCTLVWEIL